MTPFPEDRARPQGPRWLTVVSAALFVVLMFWLGWSALTTPQAPPDGGADVVLDNGGDSAP